MNLALIYPKCTTCKKAMKWTEEQGFACDTRHIKDEKPTRDELAAWYKASGLPLKRFFNTSGLIYRDMGLSTKLPTMSEDEQLDLLASDGMLVKRPLLVTDKGICPGFKAETWEKLLK